MNANPVVFTAVGLTAVMFLTAMFQEAHGPMPPPTTDGSMVVMTFNVHQLYSTGQTGQVNLEAVRDVIRESGAHIVGLQESEGTRLTSGHVNGVRWLAHALGMHAYYGPPTSDQIYGVSILSKWQIGHSGTVPLPASESIERVAVISPILTPLGSLVVLDTHLQTVEYPEDRLAQANRILDLAAFAERMVILGDFNTPADPRDEVYAILATEFTDAWAAAPDSRASPGVTELDEPVPQRIDHVWLKGDWTVESCRLHGNPRASDHLGVACRIRPG